MKTNDTYKAKKDKKGNVIIVNDEPVMELVISIEIKDEPFTKEQINEMQRIEMSSTDWYGTRFSIEKIEIPEWVISERQAIRSKYDKLKDELNNIEDEKN